MFCKRINKRKELISKIELLTKNVETVDFEIMLLRHTLESLKKDQVLYNHYQVEKLLVDFGNFLLSSERFKSINKDSNFENVTDSDISNWRDKINNKK